MNTCRTATERLLAHWNARTPRHAEGLQAELQAAIDHIHHCPRCEGRLGVLVRVLEAGTEDPLTCPECEALLPDYVEAVRIGAESAVRWQPVVAHLSGCPHCAEARAELALLVQESFGQGAQRPEHTPNPDLRFLKPVQPVESTASPAWRLDPWGRLIVELTDDLFAALLPAARQPAYALAGLKSSAPGVLLYLPIQASEADLNVTIQAERAHVADDQCVLSVQVDIPSRGGWPHLAGTEVTLRQGDREPRQEWTDAYGEAVFDGVPVDRLAGLVIEVLPGD